MGLGPNEQRLLGQIERALHGSDPKLAAKLAAFNRLTYHEAMPLRERLLRPRPGWSASRRWRWRRSSCS